MMSDELNGEIREIEYDAAAQQLDITFDTGITYRYYNITPNMVDAMEDAESEKVYFDTYIKGKYQAERID